MRISHEAELDISTGYHAIKFGAAWCGPCKRIEPLFNKIKDEFDNVKFSSIDVDEVPSLAQKYEIRTVPTIILIKNGYIKKRIPGLVLLEPLRKAFRDLMADSKEAQQIAESCVA